jgi:hypothetical protein
LQKEAKNEKENKKKTKMIFLFFSGAQQRTKEKMRTEEGGVISRSDLTAQACVLCTNRRPSVSLSF